jgi:hypothetical protein
MLYNMYYAIKKLILAIYISQYFADAIIRNVGARNGAQHDHRKTAANRGHY